MARRLLTAYVLELALFYGIGQFLALDLDVAGSRMLIVPAALYVLAMVPVAGVSAISPAPPATVRIDLTAAFRIAPVGAVSCLYTGLVSSTFSAIGPLYGTELGLGQRSVVLLMAAGQVGGLVLQYPLGLLSDRLDRRWILVAMSLGAMAVAAVFLQVGPATPLPVLIALCACFGGVVESFYPIGVAHANDRADPASYVAVSSNLLLLWGVGGAVGPIAGTLALARIGAAGFFWYALVLSAGFLVFALWRIRRRARHDAAACEEFVAYPNPADLACPVRMGPVPPSRPYRTGGEAMIRPLDELPCRIERRDPVWITLPDGTRIATAIWLPVDAAAVPVPAIVEMIPYRRRDGTVFRDTEQLPYLAAHGYAYCRVDLRGAGDSRRAARRRVSAARAAGCRGDHRLAGGPALVQRRDRHDGHLLGRLQFLAIGGTPAAGAEGDRDALRQRRPLRR